MVAIMNVHRLRLNVHLWCTCVHRWDMHKNCIVPNLTRKPALWRTLSKNLQANQNTITCFKICPFRRPPSVCTNLQQSYNRCWKKSRESVFELTKSSLVSLIASAWYARSICSPSSLLGKPKIDFVEGDLCVNSSGRPTEPTVSKTPTHLKTHLSHCYCRGWTDETHFMEKVLLSERALLLPRESGEVQWLNNASSFSISEVQSKLLE